MELILNIDASESTIFGLKIGKHPKEDEETLILFDKKEETLTIDQTKTSQNPLYKRENEKGDLAFDFNNAL